MGCCCMANSGLWPWTISQTMRTAAAAGWLQLRQAGSWLGICRSLFKIIQAIWIAAAADALCRSLVSNLWLIIIVTPAAAMCEALEAVALRARE